MPTLARQFLLTEFALVDTRHEYDHLFAIYVPIAIGVFIVIVLALGFAVVRYRGRAPARAARWSENNPLEGAYAVLLTLVAALLLYLTFTAEHRSTRSPTSEHPAVTINVTGPNGNGSSPTRPTASACAAARSAASSWSCRSGEAIRFNLRTLDVIHAFWIPEVRYKHDLIPGSTQVVTLSFDQLGRWSGQCAEFCGLRHADMVFPVHVVTAARFRAWASSHGKAPAP